MAVKIRASAHRRPISTHYNKPSCTLRFINSLKWMLVSLWHYYLQKDCEVSPQQLRRLTEHQYVSQDVSWLDELCMKKVWNNMVQLYPLWLAPNTITLIGLVINATTVAILSFFSFDATHDAPRWAYLLAAIGLFTYQSLDATDGRQARRTNSSSPLGELFDHGCDSMSQVLISLNVCLAMKMGELRYCVLIVCIVAIIMFYCAHWSTYCTGILKFSRFDVTEAQMCVIIILVITSILGPGFWSLDILGLSLKYVVILGAFLMSLCQVGSYILVIFSGGVGKNGSTVADTSVIFPLFPLLMVVVPFLTIYKKSHTGIYDSCIVPYCLCLGIVAAKATNRLVIAHMSKSELELWDWIYLAPLIMMFNQYCDYFLSEYALLCFANFYALANLLLHCTMICRQFCNHLQVDCFRIANHSRST